MADGEIRLGIVGQRSAVSRAAGALGVDDREWMSVAARWDVLRQSLVDTARRLAVTQDEAARLYGEIASRRGERADDVRRLAESAHASARRAREIANHFSHGH